MKMRKAGMAALGILCFAAAQAQVLFPRPAFVREADIMWARKVWRIIDLRQKMNQPLYYPLSPTDGRISLLDVIRRGIAEGAITPYDPSFGDDFRKKMSIEEALFIGSRCDTVMIPEPNPPYREYPQIIETPFDPSTVKRYKLKEEWYFDRQRGQMEVRILGICPVREVYDPGTGDLRGFQDMYWIYVPEAMDYFAGYPAYNPKNAGQDLSYADVLKLRIFSSVIYKKDNVQDRNISDYAQGIEGLLEGEAVKEEIMNFESDLWEN